MAAYFQKISENNFNAEGSFVVKESKTMRLVFGILFSLFAAFLVQVSLLIAIIAAILAVASFIRAGQEHIIMKINKDGFYYYGTLLTNWGNFVSARFVDEAPMQSTSSLGLSDKFFVVIRYYKDDRKCYERKIALTNTQDKSEEEIMAAIRFYYKNGLLHHSSLLSNPDMTSTNQSSSETSSKLLPE